MIGGRETGKWKGKVGRNDKKGEREGKIDKRRGIRRKRERARRK